MSINQLGKHWKCSDIARKNMSKGQIKRFENLKEREKYSNAMKGKKIALKGHTGIYIRTEKHKENHSKANRKRFENLEERKKLSEVMNRKEIKEKISKALMGEKNPSWQGGISFEPYSSEFNKQLKQFIRKRDNYTCQFPNCGKKENGQAHCIHHKDYNKKNSNPINLILLCASCNSKVNSNRNYWQKYFQNLMEGRREE